MNSRPQSGLAGPKFVHLKVHSAYSLLEGALPHRPDRQAGRGRQHAGSRADRHQQHVRRPGVLGKACRAPACSRSSAAPCRPTSATQLRPTAHARARHAMSARAGRRAPLALLRHNEQGYANLLKLASACYLEPREDEPPHIKIDHLEEHAPGPDRAHGRTLTGRSTARCATASQQLARARLENLHKTFNGSLYVEIQRHGCTARERGRAAASRARLRARHPDRRHQRGLLRHRSTTTRRTMRCSASPKARYVVEDKRRRLSREHYFKSAAQMVRAVRRPAGGAGQHDRDRQALRLPAERAASRSCRASCPPARAPARRTSSQRRRRSCGGRRRRAWRHG